jgi:hypothetical protein
MSNDDTHLGASPPYTEDVPNKPLEDEVMGRLRLVLVGDETFYEDNEGEAGSSVPYTQRQAEALEKPSCQTVECCACRDDFGLTDVTVLECKHRYYGACLKRVITQAAIEKGLAHLPPRCCGISFPYVSIINNLSEDEMEDFQDIQEEKATRHEIYFTNLDCGRLIPPQ